jgi:hypothetical protein
LIDAEQQSSKTFDKAILTFGSGAFGVSIAFLKDIAPKPFQNTLWLLGMSWLLFSAALIIILVGFVASQNACKAQIDITYESLINENEQTNRWTSVTSILAWTSVFALALAFLFAGCFVYWNKIHTT